MFKTVTEMQLYNKSTAMYKVKPQCFLHYWTNYLFVLNHTKIISLINFIKNKKK